jgi:hypothetical protein
MDNLDKELERLKSENLSLQNQLKILEQDRCAASSPSSNQP